MENNQLKFQQSFHTPFMQYPLRQEFDFKGLSSAAQAVLGGVYDSRNPLDDYTKAFISELAMPDSVRSMGPQPMTVSLESYRQFWRKASENISCYPAALSFATMKASASDELISDLECGLINIAISCGYSPRRWKHFIDVMILNKSGVTLLSCL
jgi:hypothetical protein